MICAGRTDTGVHASGQVVHFETEAQRTERSWVLGGNVNLPRDVAVTWAKPVDENFHARFSAQAREYRYEWHDMMVEIRGPIVARLANDFDIAWARAGILGDIGSFFARLMPDRKADRSEGYPVRVLYTRPTASEIRTTQLEAIRRATLHLPAERLPHR